MRTESLSTVLQCWGKTCEREAGKGVLNSVVDGHPLLGSASDRTSGSCHRPRHRPSRSCSVRTGPEGRAAPWGLVKSASGSFPVR